MRLLLTHLWVPWMLLVLTTGVALPLESTQTDWSAGDGVAGPVTEWTKTFDTASGASWLAIPDQLALTSTARLSPLNRTIGSGVDHAYAVHAADIDGDGDTDVLSAGYAPDNVVLWRNAGGHPPVWIKQVVTSQFADNASVCAADLDDDGWTDILAASWNGGEVSWWRNVGGDPAEWPQQIIDADFAGAHQVYAVDMDHDDDLDIVGAAALAHTIAWWRNDGGEPLVWTRQTVDAQSSGARSVCAADMDADGDLDLLAAAFDTHDIHLHLNHGGDPPTWERRLVDGSFLGSHWVCARDVDGDGDDDILGAAYYADAIRWWRNEGGTPPTFTRLTIDATAYGAATVLAEDLDGDGDIDALGTAWDASRVAWWENEDGTGTAWTEHGAVNGLVQASGLCAADVDSDGALDILATGAGSDRVMWSKVTEFGPSGALTSSILDLGSEIDTATLAWSVVAPPATETRLRLRASNDPAAMGSWSPDFHTPGPVTGLTGRYLQYQVELATPDPEVSPILRDVTITWDGAAGISGNPDRVGALHLEQNRPNPFNPWTTITFTVPVEGARVSLEIIDTHGRLIRTIRRRSRTAGRQVEVWDGTDGAGRPVPSGVYFYRLRSDQVDQVRRMVVAR